MNVYCILCGKQKAAFSLEFLRQGQAHESTCKFVCPTCCGELGCGECQERKRKIMEGHNGLV